MKEIKFLTFGVGFGILMIKGEVASWFRIYEMFKFDSIHMFGIIGMAVIVGLISVQIIKKFQVKTIDGSDINLKPKPFNLKANLFGGFLFGLGWALSGACPGPLYALVGSGFYIIAVVLLSAIVGAYSYGFLKNKLPH